jgi:hypothetical protein
VKCKYISKAIQMITKLYETPSHIWIWIDYTISIPYEEFHSCAFTNKHLDEVFHSNKFNCVKNKNVVEFLVFLKGKKIVLEDFVLRIHFMCLWKHYMTWRNISPKIKQNVPKKTFFCTSWPLVMWFHLQIP